jgi:hypothetical protein
MAGSIAVRRFDEPDDKLDMKDAGGIDIVKMPDGTMGMHARFEPGWTWEKDEKPLLGSPDSCPMHHTGYCISGTLVVRMVDSGTETRIRSGDFFDIPAGHDGYVEGKEPVEMILFEAAAHQH